MAELTFQEALDYVEVESYFESDWDKYKRSCLVVVENKDKLPRCVSILVPDESVSDAVWLKIRDNSEHMCSNAKCQEGEECSDEVERILHSPNCKHTPMSS